RLPLQARRLRPREGAARRPLRLPGQRSPAPSARRPLRRPRPGHGGLTEINRQDAKNAKERREEKTGNRYHLLIACSLFFLLSFLFLSLAFLASWRFIHPGFRAASALVTSVADFVLNTSPFSSQPRRATSTP